MSSVSYIRQLIHAYQTQHLSYPDLLPGARKSAEAEGLFTLAYILYTFWTDDEDGDDLKAKEMLVKWMETHTWRDMPDIHDTTHAQLVYSYCKVHRASMSESDYEFVMGRLHCLPFAATR